MSHRMLLLVVALLVLLVAVPSFAEIDKAAIEAVALDASKAPFPGVTVTVTRTETGFSSTAVTDTSGLARILALPPGNYTVEFTLEGFAPVKLQKVVLLVGQTAKLSATMQQKSAEEITVTAAAPIVDVHRTDSSTNIVPEQIQSLPVANRDFQNLAFLAPGVERERGGFRFIQGGPVIGAGGNASQSTILVNGVDFTDPALGLSRTRFSQDAIREFRVIQNRFDTEIGGSAGGALSIVTKSGTNDIHGNLFGFFRDKSLRSQDGPYSRHQLGGTIGGPILRDKFFYFASVEQINEHNTVIFHPGGAYKNLGGDVSHPFDQTLVFGSLDQQISAGQAAGERFVYERYKEDNFRVGCPTDCVADPSYGQQLNRRNWNGVFEHNMVVSTSSSNEARAQIGSHRYEEPPNSNKVAEWFSSGNTLHTGENILGDLLGAGTTWEVRDTWYQHFATGRTSHDLKAGIDGQHVKERSRIDTYANGLFLYLGDDRSLPLLYAYGVGSSDVTTHTNIYGAFVEDSFHPTTNLLLNLGVRYDLDTNGNNAGFTSPVNPQPRKRDTNNYQPRLSFSYDIGGSGENVLRGGAGRFTGRYLLVPALQELQLNGVTGRQTYTRLNGALFGIPALTLDPNHPTTTGIPSKISVNLLSQDFHNPQSDQATFGVTHRIAPRLYVDAEGIYVKGMDEVIIRNVNFGGNANPVALNKAYNQINEYTNEGHSKYEAAVLSLNGNIRQNDLLTASVTFANKKNINDDFSPEFTAGYPNDPHDIEAEYGRARGTERYRIVLSGVFHAPWNVTVAPIYEYGSGQPWTHRLGYDFNGDGFNSDRPAGVGRNTMNGPPFRQLSLRLTKVIPVSGFGSLEVIAEAFNLTDTTNYDVNSVQSGEFLSGPTLANPKAATVPNPRFGQFGSAFPGREIQLGLRWIY
jgi:hypothetical protein